QLPTLLALSPYRLHEPVLLRRLTALVRFPFSIGPLSLSCQYSLGILDCVAILEESVALCLQPFQRRQDLRQIVLHHQVSGDLDRGLKFFNGVRFPRHAGACYPGPAGLASLAVHAGLTPPG